MADSSGSTGSRASRRAAPGARALRAHVLLTTRPRSGTGGPRAGSSRSTSPRSMTPPRRAPRWSVATSPPSVPHRAGTSSPGAGCTCPRSQRALDRSRSCAASATSRAASSSTSRARPCRIPRRRAHPLPPQVGQRAARVRGPDARPPGAVPQSRHRPERRRRADVPRGRPRRGHVARGRRTRRRRAVREARSVGTRASSRTRPSAWKRSSFS